MNLKFLLKKAFPILRGMKLQVFISVLLSLLGAISGGLSIGLIIPLIDDNSEEIFQELGIDFFSSLISNDLISSEKDRIRYLAFLIIVFALVEALMTVLSAFISVKLSSKIVSLLQSKLLNKHYQLDQKYANEIDTGYFFSLISSNSLNIGALFGIMLNGVKNIFIVMIYSYALLKVSLLMTISAFFLLAVFSTLVKAYFGSKLKTQSEVALNSLETLNGSLIENIKNIKFIKSSGRWEDFEKRVNSLVDDYQNQWVKRSNINALSVPVFNSINSISIAFLLIAGTYIINQPLEDWIPLMVPFVIIIFRLISPINSLNSIRIRIEGVYPDLIKVLNFLDTSKLKKYEVGKKEFSKLESNIIVKNLKFSYQEQKPSIISNLSLEIEKKNITALIGPSGGGKTTLVDLLLKLYDYESGHIEINNLQLKDIHTPSWQQKVAYVSQDPILFNTSIINNMNWFSPDSSEKDIIDSLKKAQIWDMVNNLEGGLDFVIKDNGSEFSGGQKQRLSIARALLIDAEVLIFDEATSQVDISAEIEIYKILSTIKEDLTVIVIAHRLSALEEVDKIMIIENGRLTNSGNHFDLMKYSNFYSDSINKLT